MWIFDESFKRFGHPFEIFHEPFERFGYPFEIFHEPFERFGYPFGILNYPFDERTFSGTCFKRLGDPFVTRSVAVRFARLTESR